ncbi:hypothetical protein J2T20_004246 [Paenibacillus wynnii]|nr:hypothetical protein [Paenibacillus wynnii]
MDRMFKAFETWSLILFFEEPIKAIHRFQPIKLPLKNRKLRGTGIVPQFQEMIKDETATIWLTR